MSDKKSLMLVIAEPRSTYDFMLIRDNWSEYAWKLVDKMVETRDLLGIDTIIFSTATPVKKNFYGSDWNWGHVKASWCWQCLIEGGHLDENGNLILRFDDNALMGKCFYPEGFAVLSKEKGYGKYELIQTEEPGSIASKTTNYVKELSQDYDIKKVILLNDLGYSEPIIDESVLKNELDLSVDTFVPTKPWCNGVRSINEHENYCRVNSKLVSIEGMIDCFEQYNERIKEKGQSYCLKK